MAMCMVLSSCGEDEDVPVPAKGGRTVIVYMAGHSNMSNYVAQDINEMLQGLGAMNDGDNLVIFVDDYSTPRIYAIKGNDHEMKSALMTYNKLKPVYTYSSTLDSASPTTLQGAIDYARQHYPAESYGLVMWSHGHAWVPGTKKVSKSNMHKSFAYDAEYKSRMNIDDMVKTLERYPQFDYIFFDACFMQSIEVAYELRSTTSHILGSPTEIPLPGAPYQYVMKGLFSKPFNADAILNAYYNYYASGGTTGILLSSINTSKLEDFAAVTASVVDKQRLLDANYNGCLNYFLYNEWFSSPSLPDMYDMKGVMQRVLSSGEYTTWLKSLDETVECKYTTDTWFSGYKQGDMAVDKSQYGGISMYVPLEKYNAIGENFATAYYSTSWAKAIGITAEK